MTKFQTVSAGGLNVFYCEAGEPARRSCYSSAASPLRLISSET